MTRDEAIKAVVIINHDPLARRWIDGIERAALIVDALIAIGVFIPSKEFTEDEKKMIEIKHRDTRTVFEIGAK